MKLSIIIPVYNIRRYVGPCLQSIARQDASWVEVIVVDDGSTDGSGAVCDEIAAGDTRFHVHHIANGGVSHARNYGLEQAQGEWVLFLDGDDTLADGFFESVQTSLRDENDIVHFGWNYISANESAAHPISENDEAVKRDEVYGQRLFHGYVWSYLFRRNIIEEARLRFSTDVKYAEDWEFILKYYVRIERMMMLTHCLYNYVQREGSAVSQAYGERFIGDNFKMYDRVMASAESGDRSYRSFALSVIEGSVFWMARHVVYPNKRKLIGYYKKCVAGLGSDCLKHNYIIASVPYVSETIHTNIYRLSKRNHMTCNYLQKLTEGHGR